MAVESATRQREDRAPVALDEARRTGREVIVVCRRGVSKDVDVLRNLLTSLFFCSFLVVTVVELNRCQTVRRPCYDNRLPS